MSEQESNRIRRIVGWGIIIGLIAVIGLSIALSLYFAPWNSALAQVDGNDTQDDESQLPGQDGEPPTQPPTDGEPPTQPPTDGEPPTQPPTNDTGGGGGNATEPLTVRAIIDIDQDATPVVGFEADIEGGREPYTCQWNLGDGTTSDVCDVSHIYENPGTYTATLTVTDATNQTASDSIEGFLITNTGGVEPEPLTASARWDTNDGANAPATFRFEGDAEGGTEPYTFQWDFGDGQQATGRFILHTYENPGTYTATLTVTDATNQTASDSTQATVHPPPTNDTDCQFDITTDEEIYEPEGTVTITVTNNGNESLEFPNSLLGLVIENLDTSEVFPLVSAQVITTLEPGESNTFEFTYEELVNEIGTGTIEARVSTTDGCSDSTTFTLTDDTNGEPPTPGGNRSETSNRISVQIQPPGCTSISDAEHWNKIVFRITSDPTGRIDSSLINTELEVLERVNDGGVINVKDIVRYSIVTEPGILPQLTLEEADQLEIEILDVEYALICFTS